MSKKPAKVTVRPSNAAKSHARIDDEIAGHGRSRLERNLEKARRVEACRPIAGIKAQVDLARALDVSPQRMNQWLTGRAGLPDEFLMKIAELMKVPPEYLAFGDSSRLPSDIRKQVVENIGELELYEKFKRKYGW